MTRISKLLLAAGALALVSGTFASLPARAQDEDSAAQQAVDVDHSSNDAANADTDEQAKDLSNQGFDTPNTDPAPSSSDDSSDGN